MLWYTIHVIINNLKHKFMITDALYFFRLSMTTDLWSDVKRSTITWIQETGYDIRCTMQGRKIASKKTRFLGFKKHKNLSSPNFWLFGFSYRKRCDKNNVVQHVLHKSQFCVRSSLHIKEPLKTLLKTFFSPGTMTDKYSFVSNTSNTSIAQWV